MKSDMRKTETHMAPFFIITPFLMPEWLLLF